MKKKNLTILLALLAALALVFAGACSDGSDDGGGLETETDVISANATAIAAVLDGISTEVDSGISDVAWAFKTGSATTAETGWDASTATYTLFLASGDSQGSGQPKLSAALGGVQGLETVVSSDKSVSILFSTAEAASDNTAAANNTDDYRIAVTVVLGTAGNTDIGTITIVLPYSVVTSDTSNGWTES